MCFFFFFFFSFLLSFLCCCCCYVLYFLPLPVLPLAVFAGASWCCGAVCCVSRVLRVACASSALLFVFFFCCCAIRPGEMLPLPPPSPLQDRFEQLAFTMGWPWHGPDPARPTAKL
jgi:hypothetical protein